MSCVSPSNQGEEREHKVVPNDMNLLPLEGRRVRAFLGGQSAISITLLHSSLQHLPHLVTQWYGRPPITSTTDDLYHIGYQTLLPRLGVRAVRAQENNS